VQLGLRTARGHVRTTVLVGLRGLCANNRRLFACDKVGPMGAMCEQPPVTCKGRTQGGHVWTRLFAYGTVSRVCAACPPDCKISCANNRRLFAHDLVGAKWLYKGRAQGLRTSGDCLHGSTVGTTASVSHRKLFDHERVERTRATCSSHLLSRARGAQRWSRPVWRPKGSTHSHAGPVVPNG
jgi:hypothetical protein